MASRVGGGWRPWRFPAVPAGLGLLELALARLAGPPGRQVEVLRQLGEGATDPVAPLLALLALGAEGLAAYLLVVLGLRLLALLPGALGRLAAGAALRVTPVAVRRALDLVIGGALLAHVTLAPLPARASAAPPPLAVASTAAASAGRSPAPLPPWLGDRPPPGAGRAGSSAAAGAEPGAPGAGPVPGRDRGRPADAGGAGESQGAPAAGAHTIRPGDTLWGIGAAHLPPAKRSPAAIDRYWRQVYRANRATLGPDPDLIHPGTRLLLPPDQQDRR